VQIDASGLQALGRDLKKAGDGLDKELKKVGKDAAELVAVHARQSTVPVRTGRLRGRIKAGATLKGGNVSVSGLPYVGPIHFGWRRHNISPNPFLYEALDARADEVLERYGKGVDEVIAKSIESKY
jgi:hypothetical protein